MNEPPKEVIAGFEIYRNLLSQEKQIEMVDACREIIRQAPLVRPMTAWGKPMTVRMTSAGRAGWVIHRGKYQYRAHHPETDLPWPQIPPAILEPWRRLDLWPGDPACCLLNWYDAEARMGLHQDKDEGLFEAPVLSISLGDPARFRMGGIEKGSKTQSTILSSGDVVVMRGDARLAYHGIDRILADGLPNPITARGRINLTLRVVDPSLIR
ncbi:MAG: alpha-ketoglutarate-dependent dioxygenase AlkB [Pseudomonadota bacterium]